MQSPKDSGEGSDDSRVVTSEGGSNWLPRRVHANRRQKRCLSGGAALVAMFTLVACGIGGVGATDDQGQVVLQSYDVPPEHRQEVRDMLQSALRGDGTDPVGRVTTGPGGTMVVVAPPQIQTGIRQMLNAGFDALPPQSRVKLTYWLLVGRPVTTRDGPASFSVAGTRPLDRLEPVMAQFVAAQGSSEFSLLEEIQLSSMLQDQAGSSGKMAKVSQTVTLAGEQIVAQVNITLPPDHLFRSQVSLLAGQYLVVGQTGFDARGILGFAVSLRSHRLPPLCFLTLKREMI